MSGILMFISMMLLWSVYSSIPFCLYWEIPIFIMMVVLGLNTFNSVMSGWSSFSKFSLIGSIRTVSQLVSYESALYFCFFFFIIILMGYTFSESFFHLPLLMFPACVLVWVPSFLAELNRTPYDFSEGESELVSGFNTEFGSNVFTLIFLSEYGNILFFCYLSAIFFFNSVSLFIYFFFFVLWSRAVLPRFRFDKLMLLAWKFLIPFVTLYFLFFSSFCF